MGRLSAANLVHCRLQVGVLLQAEQVPGREGHRVQLFHRDRRTVRRAHDAAVCLAEGDARDPIPRHAGLGLGLIQPRQDLGPGRFPFTADHRIHERLGRRLFRQNGRMRAAEDHRGVANRLDQCCVAPGGGDLGCVGRDAHNVGLKLAEHRLQR